MARKNLSTTQRNEIVQFLMQNSINGQPVRGKIKEAMAKFNSSQRTVTRLWAAAREQMKSGVIVHLQRMKPNTPMKKKVQLNLQMIQKLELHKRSTIRKLAVGIKCSKSTVGRWVQAGLIKSHTNAIKPNLTAPNKLLRLSFSLEALELDRILNIIKFRSMNNIVDIDEKWFYLTKASHRYYLTPEEAEPHRTCKHKNFITKVMFMCAVCRPMFREDGSILFDGKIGIFPFTEKVPAKRNSKNRTAGTLETKPIQSITKEVIKECLINQILPAIMAKWPENACKLIFIQQDNAKPHIKDNDIEFRNAATQQGFDIRLTRQPPNSPDTNVNDLGWFRAIQSIQIETSSVTVDQLVNAVILSFEALSPVTLNKVFLSLQGCMVEIMKLKGENCYKIPHLKKDSLIRLNQLPTDLEVPESLVKECITYLMQNGRVYGIHSLAASLGLQGFQ